MSVASPKIKAVDAPPSARTLRELAFLHLRLPSAIITPSGLLTEVNLAFTQLAGMTSTVFEHEARLGDFVLEADRRRFNDWLKSPPDTVTWFETKFVDCLGIEREVAISLSALPEMNHAQATILDRSKWERSGGSRQTEELANLFMLVSHNLKSPIVSILGFTRLMSESLADLDEKQLRRFLERIDRNATRLEKMVRDIIEFSKLANHSPAVAEVSIGEIVANTLTEFHYQIKQRGVVIVVAENFPIVTGVAEKLSAVFNNLIDNAIKYSVGSANPTVEISWEEKPRFYVFSIKDNGIGVPEQYLEKVFEPFERGAADASIEGTGLGLAIVKRIIEQHGGVTHLSSVPAQGTTVYFTLPRTALSRP
jgi:signal transduction histidine kinase